MLFGYSKRIFSFQSGKYALYKHQTLTLVPCQVAVTGVKFRSYQSGILSVRRALVAKLYFYSHSHVSSRLFYSLHHVYLTLQYIKSTSVGLSCRKTAHDLKQKSTLLSRRSSLSFPSEPTVKVRSHLSFRF